MTNVISVSLGGNQDILRKIEKYKPDNMTRSSFFIHIFRDWLEQKNMDSFIFGESQPTDASPLHIWEQFIKTHDVNELKKLLTRRREINNLLEVRLFD